MTAAVRAARRLADVVIISCHWGIEYSAYPTADQMRISQALADAGADLVIGHHPHVVQGVHYHAETFTVYSLGNFIFDIDLTAESLQGAMLRCLLDATGVKTVEMIPVAIVGCRPEIMPPEHAETVLARMERVTRESRGFPTTIKKTRGFPAGTHTVHPLRSGPGAHRLCRWDSMTSSISPSAPRRCSRLPQYANPIIVGERIGTNLVAPARRLLPRLISSTCFALR